MSITTARTKTTAELLHGAAAGDQDCWNELFRQFNPLLRSVVSGYRLEEEADLNAPAPDERAIDKETVLDALEAFGHLPDDSQDLLRLLVATPPLPYTEIAERIGRPIGSIGPTRRRCIEALKSHMDEFSLPAAA